MLSKKKLKGWQESYLEGSLEAEHELFLKFSNEIIAHQAKIQRNERTLQPDRVQHAKVLCAVNNAELIISDRLPKELTNEVIQPGCKFSDCYVRFSNASGRVQSDSVSDLRGLAIRAMASDNQPFDMLMTNAQASHARTAKQFMAFVKAGTHKSRIRMIFSLLWQIGLLETIRMIRTLLKQTKRKVYSLGAETFWSRSPYKIGDCAFQFFAEGQLPPSQLSEKTLENPNYLSKDIINRLKERSIDFKIWIRPYKNESITPIEDGSVKWPNSNDDILFATLTLPKSSFSENQFVASEIQKLEFNPWNSSHILYPLGNLNRARQQVYRAAADGRSLQRGSKEKESILIRLTTVLGRILVKFRSWHKFPGFIGTFILKGFRDQLREKNLADTRTALPSDEVKPIGCCPFKNFRTADGSYNDLTDPQMGMAGTSFGQNIALKKIVPDEERKILEPDPRRISRELMTRHQFKPASTLNVLAAGWIQFMIHDWFAHTTEQPEDEEKQAEAYRNRIRVPINSEDPWIQNAKMHEGCPVMELRRTEVNKYIKTDSGEVPAYSNRQSHWWDGSQLYGNSLSVQHQLRTFEKGKLKFDYDNGRLPLDKDSQVGLTGVTDNSWIGLEIMHTIFVQEHNAICDALAASNVNWDDEQIFGHARLINAALMAKIHTVEWTPAILGHPALKIGMAANWWGLIGPVIKKLYGRVFNSESLSGIIQSNVDHHSAPYSLTEEFVTVYRMHPLLPDTFQIVDSQTGQMKEKILLKNSVFEKSRQVIEKFPMADLIFSLGTQNPGAITINNYPKFLQNLPKTPGSRIIDLAATDIIRDRERGVPRYNDFRESLHRPRLKSFEDLHKDPELVKIAKKIYNNDINQVDTMVGMFCEEVPKGFGFSDTAFRVFILMASRRLKSDRFFCEDYNAQVYTQLGLDWIENNNMKTVLCRHYPELTDALTRAKSGFEPWLKL